VNIQDVFLQGKGINRLSEQVNPAYKGTIDEKDITNYQELLDKIHRRLLESQNFLPEQDRTQIVNVMESPEQRPQTTQVPTSAISGGISPSPFRSAGSSKGGFKMPANMASMSSMMETLGVSNVINQVQKRASDTVSIL